MPSSVNIAALPRLARDVIQNVRFVANIWIQISARMAWQHQLVVRVYSDTRVSMPALR